MSPPSLFFLGYLLLGIQLIILVVGFVLFFVQSKRRRTIGKVLIVLGSVELPLLPIIPVSIATIILGIVSLYYASRNSKTNSGSL